MIKHLLNKTTFKEIIGDDKFVTFGSELSADWSRLLSYVVTRQNSFQSQENP